MRTPDINHEWSLQNVSWLKRSHNFVGERNKAWVWGQGIILPSPTVGAKIFWWTNKGGYKVLYNIIIFV
jgi:hypothetical protein